MKVGITGHQHLADSSVWTWVEECIRGQLLLAKPLVGISSLAVGADQLFASLVLQSGGQLIAIIPSSDYVESFGNKDERTKYQLLRSQACEVRVLPDNEDVEESYLQAGYCVVDLCDLLIAVWNGHPAQGKGGTGDAVAYALRKEKKVVHINPERKSVTQL